MFYGDHGDHWGECDIGDGVPMPDGDPGDPCDVCHGVLGDPCGVFDNPGDALGVLRRDGIPRDH